MRITIKFRDALFLFLCTNQISWRSAVMESVAIVVLMRVIFPHLQHGRLS